MTARSQRPTIIEIDLGALRRNYHALREAAGTAEMMVVVKADAYGHGAVPIAKTLAAEGCGHFGVATIAEASELRDAGIRTRIYLLGGFFPEQAREILALEVTPVHLRCLDCRAAQCRGEGARHSSDVAGPSENRYRRDAARRVALGTRARDRGVARRDLAPASKARARCSRTPPIPTSNITDRNCASSSMRSRRSAPPACVPRWCMPTTRPRWCCGPTRISIWYARASRFMACLRCWRCAKKSIYTDHDLQNPPDADEARARGHRRRLWPYLRHATRPR